MKQGIQGLPESNYPGMHTHTHKDYGQSVVNGLTPQALVLQTHPLPVFIRRKWEQQCGGRKERHSRMKVRLNDQDRNLVLHVL